MKLSCSLSLLILPLMASLLTGQPASAEPAIYVESIVAPPGASRAVLYHDPTSVSVSLNADVKGARDACTMILSFDPVMPSTPPQNSTSGLCVELSSPFDGPLSIYNPIDTPNNVPDGTEYRLNLSFYGRPVQDKDPITLAKIYPGVLIIRKKPFIKGDLNDDQKLGLSDAILSLRLAVGLGEATDYERAAGDADRDGRLTLADTTRLLRWVIGNFDDNLPASALWNQLLLSGQDSAYPAYAHFLIKSPEEWASLWRQHRAGKSPAPTLPEVDFSQFMVLAAFVGPRPTSGNEVTGIRAIADPREIRLTVQRIRPANGTNPPMIPTNPYAFFLIPRLDFPVSFEPDEVNGIQL